MPHEFEANVRDIVGLYLKPLDRAPTLCGRKESDSALDEKGMGFFVDDSTTLITG